mmetsp:Transcript_120479/g.326935  ORF Transcript_120479/g.326935 Transcript_120479/m.326935 type:complete len:244 (+) Transcript_120479:522-1253(+)
MMSASVPGTSCARRCSSVLTAVATSRRMKHSTSCAAPPVTSSSATPHVRSMADFTAISTTCWLCHTPAEGRLRRSPAGQTILFAATNSRRACWSHLGACVRSMMRLPNILPSVLSYSCQCEVSPTSCTLGAMTSGPAFVLALAVFASADCSISRWNSSNHDPMEPSCFSYCRPGNGKIGPFPLSSLVSSSLSSQVSSPTFSPACFLLNQFSCRRSRRNTLLATGVSPTLSGCQVLKSLLMTSL